MLLGPVASQLGTKRLVIVGDGALHYTPFAALPEPHLLKEVNKQWQPLATEHEVVDLPSASTLDVLRRELAGRNPAPKSIAVLADPVFEKDDERVKSGPKVSVKSNQPTSDLGQERLLKQVAQTFSKPGAMRIPRLPY